MSILGVGNLIIVVLRVFLLLLLWELNETTQFDFAQILTYYTLQTNVCRYVTYIPAQQQIQLNIYVLTRMYVHTYNWIVGRIVQPVSAQRRPTNIQSI